MQEGEQKRSAHRALPTRDTGTQPYLYQQTIPLEGAPVAPPHPQRIRRLLDELHQSKLDLQQAHQEVASLEQRLAEAESRRMELLEQLRHWQQQGLRWRNRLKQTEGLLKRVLKQYRDLSSQLVKERYTRTED
ncbi:MAG: hypothetical protein ACM3ZQ_09725 [Bacillota bacterium]